MACGNATKVLADGERVICCMKKKELIIMFFGEAQRNQKVRDRLVMTIEEGLQPLHHLLKQKITKDDDYLFLAIRNVQTSLVMYFLLYDRFQTDPVERKRYINMTVQQFIKSNYVIFN